MGGSHGGRAPSQRQLRVGEEIRRVLAHMLRRCAVRDPVLSATPITLTAARASPDLREATIFFTPLGGRGDAAAIREALIHAQPFLRHSLSRRLTLKYTPRLSFEIDESFDEAAHIDALMRDPKVLRDLAPRRCEAQRLAARGIGEGAPESEDGDGTAHGA